jgi:hypothetical protein
MALGAYQQQAVQRALMQARLTGRPVPIPGGLGLMAQPNGSVGTLGGGGFPRPAAAMPTPPMPPNVVPNVVQPVQPSTPASNVAGVPGAPGSPSGPAVYPSPSGPILDGRGNQYNPQTQQWSPIAQPSPALPSTTPGGIMTDPTTGYTAIPGTNTAATPAPAAAATQPPLNQATFSAAGVPGLPGSPSGPAVYGPAGEPPARTTLPDLEVTARRYRDAHGLSDTDALNAQSLAAAQAGRNYLNPQLATQYAQRSAAGVPDIDVVNALSLPPPGGSYS